MTPFMDIFEWASWDIADPGKIFYDCVLLRSVGGYNEGEFFSNISFDDEKMVLNFYKDIEDYEPIMVKKFKLDD